MLIIYFFINSEYNLKFVNKIFIPTADSAVETNFFEYDDDNESPYVKNLICELYIILY